MTYFDHIDIETEIIDEISRNSALVDDYEDFWCTGRPLNFEEEETLRTAGDWLGDIDHSAIDLEYTDTINDMPS